MAARPGIILVLIAALGLTVRVLSSSRTPVLTMTPFKTGLSLILGGGLTIETETVGEKLDQPGLPNLYRHDEGIYSGGLPEGQTGFRTLADLGVQTVISVDGAEPDIEAAAAAGLRYVHLPIGYNGIARSRLIELYVAMHDLPGPFYIHCHRGLHRGPAAAVAVCQMEGAFATPDEVDARLKELGTAPKYSGLYRDARAATPVTPAERQSIDASQLVNRAAVPPLTQRMVELEHAWDRWGKEINEATGWNKAAQSEAVILSEILTEAGRLLENAPEKSPLRTALLEDGRWLAEAADRAEGSPSDLTKQIRLRCDNCHARFRDY